MPRKKKTEVESKEMESKEVKDNRTLAQKLANYKRPLRRI